MAVVTRSRIAGLTPYALLMTFETAVVETFARAATSTIVTRRGGAAGSMMLLRGRRLLNV
jgi:hypothetical protein